MRHRQWIQALGLAGAAIAAPLVLTGCQATETHEQQVQAADGRWLAMRSGLMLEMAQQHFDTGDLDLAQKTVVDAMQLDPTNAPLHVLAGRIMLERGRLEQSYELLETAIRLDAKSTDAYYYSGLVLQRWQRYEQAFERYSRAYELAPDQPSYLIAMSEMLVEEGRLDEAIGLIEDKLTYFGQNAGLRATVGHLYMMRGRPDKAVGVFEQAALLAPDTPKMLEELALAQVAAGENAAGIATFRRLFAMPGAEKRPGLRRSMAAALLELGRVEEARAIYLELARGESGDAGDWIKLAELSWREGDLGGTLHAANRVVTLAPHRHEGYLLAGMVWQKRDRLDDALRMFDRAAEVAPSNAEPLILRGLSLQRAGRGAAAAEAYQLALSRQPDDLRARRLLESVTAQ